MEALVVQAGRVGLVVRGEEAPVEVRVDPGRAAVAVEASSAVVSRP